MTWTPKQIAELVGGRLIGAGDLPIRSMQPLDRAGRDQLAFIRDERYARDWPRSRAGAALIAERLDIEPGDGRALIRVGDVDLAVARVLGAMAPPPPAPEAGVHPTAAVDPSAELGASVRIGPHCSVGARARIGEGAILHPGVHILDDCRIGAGCVLWPGVVVRERCSLGDRCILHPNAVIGADGFGYRRVPDGGGPVKIPQIGTVRIGDGVEIGAATCIDRGKFDATEIGDGTKIDNLVQIGHNCRIGRHVIIVAGCSIGGSVTIGHGATLGGAAIVTDHITIGAGARLAGGAALIRDVPPGESWAGYNAKPAKIHFRELAAMSRLPDLVRRRRPR